MYTNMLRTRHEHVDAIVVDPVNFNKFIFRIRHISGPNNEFSDGEYLFELNLSENFPIIPPDLVFLTPNGVYELNGSICISTGKYHPQNYVATRGLLGFGIDVMTAMILYPGLGGGIKIVKNRTPKNIRKLASKSRAFNLRNHTKYISDLNNLPPNVKYDLMESHDVLHPDIKRILYRFLGF